jgi:amino acid transporter
MGLPDAVSLVVGCIIGAGIFRMAAPIAQQIQHPGLVLATWLAGGLISLCGAACYAELGAAFPKCGGDYVYLTTAYGRAVGFLFGWTKLFIERTGTIAVLGFVFAEYLGYFTGYGLVGVRLAATAAIIGLTAANLVGVRYGAGVQNLFTALKLLALAAIVGVGWTSGGARPELLQPWWPTAPSLSHLQACGVALVFVLWTYGGWTESAYVAEEIRRPERNVPRSIFLGVGLTTALYLVVNLIYMLYVPLAEMPQQKLVAAEMMRRALGPWAGGLVSLGVVCSTFGALNGYVLTSGRLLYAIGAEHPLVGRLGVVHPRWATPARALAFNAVWSVALVATGTLDQIVTYSTVIISPWRA